MFLVIALQAFFASVFTIGKEALSYVPPIFFIGIRMTIAGILLLAFVRWGRKQSWAIKPADRAWFAPIVVFHIYLSYILEYVALNYLTSVKACLLFNLSPFITALFSYIFFAEVMTNRKWLGLTIGFIAFIPTFLSQAPAEELTGGTIGIFSIPELLLIMSVVSACIGWIAMKKLTTERGYSYFFVNGFGMLIGGLAALATSYCFESIPTFAAATDIKFLTTLASSIIIGNFLCFNLYGYLLHRYSATLLSFFGFMTPLFAALFGWFWLGEEVSISFFLTFIIVTYGLYIFYQEELRQGYINQD